MTIANILPIGALPALGSVSGFFIYVRFLVSGRPMSKNSMIPLMFLSAVMPVFVIEALSALGVHGLMPDSAALAYIVAFLLTALFFALFWATVVLKEGRDSETLNTFLRPSTSTRPISVRIVSGMVVLVIAASLYALVLSNSSSRTPCSSIWCDLEQWMWAEHGTIYGPLMYAGVLNSPILCVVMAGLMKALILKMSQYPQDQ